MLLRPLLRHWPIAALREWLLWVVSGLSPKTAYGQNL